MTNWNDLILLIAEALAFIKLVHVTAGVYFWEFVLNFDYEYSVITGKRKFNRTVPIYLICRWSTLVAMIMHLLAVDNADEISCQAWATATFIFAYLAFQSASCLIILRIYALWKKNRIVLVTTIAFSLANTAAFFYNIAITRAYRAVSFCDVDHILETRITIFSSFITDLVLLSLMLIGVLRWKHARQTGGIWRVMYTQGLIYVVVVTLADIPPVVLISLNLNDVMSGIFMVPSMIIMSIGALRMYRGLVDSAALNGSPAGVVGIKGLSTKEEIFARPTGCREQDRVVGASLDSHGSSPNSQRMLVMKRQDVESFGSETV